MVLYMTRPDQNDMGYDLEFFQNRSRIKNPKSQKKVLVIPVIETIDLDMNSKRRNNLRGNKYQHTKTGARLDLGGIVARSAWEADTMRILQLFKIPFEFEPTIFTFPADTRGRTSAYLPDIFLTKTKEYIEVKGLLDARGRNKLRKFKKFYPNEFAGLTVIISKSNKTNKFFFEKLGVKNILYYEHLSKLFGKKIALWEGRLK